MNNLISFFQSSSIEDIYEKVSSGERLSAEDGIRLYKNNNLFAIGKLAQIAAEKINGNKVTYVYNQHINYSNVCQNECRFCAFGKKDEQDGGYTLSLDQIENKIRQRLSEPITELHIVGSIHPGLNYDYYLQMISRAKKIRSHAYIKAFTAVEIAHIAKISNQSIEKTLFDLKENGLDCIPGGGAEIFSPRVRKKLCPEKLPGEKWLEIARTAHKMGIPSNATMLYGHIETIEERIDHLLKLREIQDETRGFLTFIPLTFHPQNTKLSHLSSTSAIDDLKTIAVSRLMLDNIPHIKAYWVMLGVKLAQVALSFGADDLDGTVIEEKITTMAGGNTQGYVTVDQMKNLIASADRKPVQRDTLFRLKE